MVLFDISPSVDYEEHSIWELIFSMVFFQLLAEKHATSVKSAVQQMLSMIMSGYSSGQASYDDSSVYTGTSGNYTSHYTIISVYLLF